MTDLVDIQLVDDSAKTPDAQQIRGWVAAVFTTLERSPLALTVRVVGEEEMAKLNRRYRGRDQPTNVLSFPSAGTEEPPAPPGEPIILGDIIVAFETSAAEAKQQGKPLADHFCHLIVHGMLHLLGFDHQTDIMANAMEALEIKVLAGLDITNPYEDGVGEDKNQ